jgi:hypothetical protein
MRSNFALQFAVLSIKHFKKRADAVTDPLLLVPGNMREVSCKQIVDGKAYCLMFRKP